MDSFTAKQQSISRSMSVAARSSPVELHAHLHEPSHGSRGLLNQDAYGFAVAMTCASSQCILKMECGTIVRPKGYRKAALSIARVAFPKLPFGKEGDTQRVR